ncbi:unnamed protein product [Ectocarpus sp. CCAP 1310/34]|nr:unnamed protein product [Ectocarpus sp. CCAP 1310/34]
MPLSPPAPAPGNGGRPETMAWMGSMELHSSSKIGAVTHGSRSCHPLP